LIVMLSRHDTIMLSRGILQVIEPGAFIKRHQLFRIDQFEAAINNWPQGLVGLPPKARTHSSGLPRACLGRAPGFRTGLLSGRSVSDCRAHHTPPDYARQIKALLYHYAEEKSLET
jgi:hypothetical protein